MISRLLYVAVFALAALPTVILAQPAANPVGKSRMAEHREEVVADAAESTRQEALKSHPEQMRAQLRLLAGQFNAAGLTDEVDVIEALEQRIKGEHFQLLMEAHRRALANAFQPQFSLKVQIVELLETEETIAEMNELIGAHNALSADVLETAHVSGWIEKQKELGLLKVVSEEKVALLNGRAAVIQQGRNIDVQSLSGNRARAKTGAAKDAAEVEFIGTSVRATLKLMPEGIIQLSSVTETSSVTPANKAGRSGIHRNRFQAESELHEGQSLLISGVKSTGNVAESTRIPVLGDIPVLGPRLFSSNKITPVTNHLMFVATPQIVRRSAEDDPEVNQRGAIQPASLSRPAK